MPAAADRLEFAPPPPPGLLRALALAVAAHLLLLAALTVGLRWTRDAQDLAAEAELWSALPQQAAPPEVQAAPPPPPPPPAPVVRAPEPPPQAREADIAVERERQRREAEAQAERRRVEQERRRAQEQRAKAEAERRQAELKQQEQARLAQERRREQERVAAENRRKEEERKRREQQQQEARLKQLREENLARMQGLAGGSPSSTTAGTAAQSSGPSASWAGRVRARVKPNIVFTDAVAGNPEARVEVRLSPDGTIVGKRITRSSGLQAWDEAVLRALDKTEVLPRDVDGRVPSPVELIFRPRD